MFFAVDLLSWHHAIEYVGAGLATVLGNLQVLIVALAAWLLFGERPRRNVLLALPVVLLGVVLISGVVGSERYGDEPAAGRRPRPGDRARVFGLPAHHPPGEPTTAAGRAGRHSPRCDRPVRARLRRLVGTLDLVPTWPAHGWLLALGFTAQSRGYLLIRSRCRGCRPC